jgi:DNA anti-recombination protein RmuC
MADKTLTTDERFDKVDEQFLDMKKQFDGANKQLERIATAVVGGFGRIGKTLEEKASNADMQKVLGLLDALSKRQEISDDERLVMGHQLDRLDRWTHELAKKIGYKLTI